MSAERQLRVRTSPLPDAIPAADDRVRRERVDEMRRAILLLLVLVPVLTFAVRADSASEPDLAGVYLGNGKNIDGTSYEGLVEIYKDHGAFQLQWVVEDKVVAVGMGLLSGNVLAVAYYSALPGVVAYRLEGSDKLVGEWTLVGAEGAVFSETLTKVPPDKVGKTPSRPARPARPVGDRRGGQLKDL
jgi:hypothetical protein